MHAHEKWTLKNSNIMKRDPVNLLLETVKKFLALFGNPQNKKLETITLPVAENLSKSQRMRDL
ncbi:MAG: hypothetical protein CMD20_01380 [Flavobacteriales bacterium]|nr:hypothetical protein [Flavobacteriales bacterium]